MVKNLYLCSIRGKLAIRPRRTKHTLVKVRATNGLDALDKLQTAGYIYWCSHPRFENWIEERGWNITDKLREALWSDGYGNAEIEVE